MVKMPRQVKRYSPLRASTPFTPWSASRRARSELRWGQRRFRKVTAGYRGFPVKPDGREKPTKRVNILYRCTETGKAHYACKRAKKFELVDR